MSVDAIGSVLNPQDASVTRNNTIDQEDFIKLFLAQLQFQDPVEDLYCAVVFAFVHSLITQLIITKLIITC